MVHLKIVICKSQVLYYTDICLTLLVTVVFCCGKVEPGLPVYCSHMSPSLVDCSNKYVNIGAVWILDHSSVLLEYQIVRVGEQIQCLRKGP